MSQKMNNAPVYYALAQAKFNPIAAMAKYIGDVQDILRQEGYTLFDPKHSMKLEIVTPPGQEQAGPQVEQSTSWLISKADRTAGFIVSPSAITFHTTHYETHKEFITALLLGLETVTNVVKLDHVSRLGVRYLDAVLPVGAETVEQYLASGLHGVSFSAVPRRAMTESVFETACGPLVSKGTLVARVYQLTAALGYPPDMIPNGLLPMPKFDIKQPHAHAVIDMDHFVEDSMPLDFEKLNKQLGSLHDTISLAFRAITTDHARLVWD